MVKCYSKFERWSHRIQRRKLLWTDTVGAYTDEEVWFEIGLGKYWQIFVKIFFDQKKNTSQSLTLSHVLPYAKIAKLWLLFTQAIS